MKLSDRSLSAPRTQIFLFVFDTWTELSPELMEVFSPRMQNRRNEAEGKFALFERFGGSVVRCEKRPQASS